MCELRRLVALMSTYAKVFPLVGRCRSTLGFFAVDPTFAFRNFQGLSKTFRDFQLLKLKYEKLLSDFAFNFNLRHYNKGMVPNVLRTLPSSGVTFLVYESTRSFLSAKQDKE